MTAVLWSFSTLLLALGMISAFLAGACAEEYRTGGRAVTRGAAFFGIGFGAACVLLALAIV